MKKFKTIQEYADHLVGNYGPSLIENNLEIRLPESFSSLPYEEKMEFLLQNHAADLEEDMLHYNENCE